MDDRLRRLERQVPHGGSVERGHALAERARACSAFGDVLHLAAVLGHPAALAVCEIDIGIPIPPGSLAVDRLRGLEIQNLSHAFVGVARHRGIRIQDCLRVSHLLVARLAIRVVDMGLERLLDGRDVGCLDLPALAHALSVLTLSTSGDRSPDPVLDVLRSRVPADLLREARLALADELIEQGLLPILQRGAGD